MTKALFISCLAGFGAFWLCDNLGVCPYLCGVIQATIQVNLFWTLAD